MDRINETIATAVMEEREACAQLAESTAKACQPRHYLTGELLPWDEHASHSDAHDSCHEALDIASSIRNQ